MCRILVGTVAPMVSGERVGKHVALYIMTKWSGSISFSFLIFKYCKNVCLNLCSATNFSSGNIPFWPWKRNNPRLTSNTVLEQIQDFNWVPVCTSKPEGYPDGLTWYQNHSLFSSIVRMFAWIYVLLQTFPLEIFLFDHEKDLLETLMKNQKDPLHDMTPQWY
jgi:hypothetical protein